jgi:hypothetical protein
MFYNDLSNFSGRVDSYAIYLLIRTFYRPGAEGVTRNAWKIPTETGVNPTRPFVKEGTILALKWKIKDRIEGATLIPFSFSEAPSTPAETVIQCISTMWYLAKRYPQHFNTPQIYNNFLSFAVGWRLDSVEAIFRDCFDHFPLSQDKISELYRKRLVRQKHNRFRHQSRNSWHWPLPDISSPSIPFLPQQLPRPDKFTFMRAMEYAYFRRLVPFAREVWAHREAWIAQIEKEAQKDIEMIQWSEVNDDDALRYESYLVDKRDRGWARRSLKLSEETEGAANTLYEGYIRLLYIEILTFGNFFEEAFEAIKEGTGERYQWNQGMLRKVRKVAEFHSQREICEYIDSLEESGMETGRESSDDLWEHPP